METISNTEGTDSKLQLNFYDFQSLIARSELNERAFWLLFRGILIMILVGIPLEFTSIPFSQTVFVFAIAIVLPFTLAYVKRVRFLNGETISANAGRERTMDLVRAERAKFMSIITRMMAYVVLIQLTLSYIADWKDLDDWRCPLCGAHKSMFNAQE